MLPRLHRPLAALIPVLFLGLAACGGDSGPRPTDIDGPEGFDAVEISGDPGSAPTVTWKGQMEAGDLEVETLTKGEGDTVAAGDSVYVNYWVGNGFTQEETFSSYAEGTGLGEQLTVDASQLPPIFLSGIEDQTKGSRVAVVGSAEEAFGIAGQPSLNIGDGDTVLMVFDLMEDPKPVKPTGVAASRLPKVVEKDGKVTRLDFTGLDEPAADGDLLRSVIKKGTGETLTADSTITANYLGQVYGADAPFDESYSAEKPVEFSLQGVVQGWTDGLTGLKVGARVLLQIPPRYGYGGAEQADIPANSTLYFVIDVVSVKSADATE